MWTIKNVQRSITRISPRSIPLWLCYYSLLADCLNHLWTTFTILEQRTHSSYLRYACYIDKTDLYTVSSSILVRWWELWRVWTESRYWVEYFERWHVYYYSLVHWMGIRLCDLSTQHCTLMTENQSLYTRTIDFYSHCIDQTLI